MSGYENQPIPKEGQDCSVLVPDMIKALVDGERIGLHYSPGARPSRYDLKDYINGISERCDKELHAFFMAHSTDCLAVDKMRAQDALFDAMKNALVEECKRDAGDHAAYLRKFGING